MLSQYKSVMPEKVFNQTLTNASLYKDYLFGFCFEEVRGKAIVKNEVDFDAWQKLGDADVTLDLKLFDPKVSPDTFTVVDRSKSGKSCWTQHDTVAAALSMQPVMEELLKLPSEHLSILANKSGEGFNQRTILYNPQDGFEPVIVYLHITYSPKQERILGIIKEASVSEKNND